MPRSTSTPDTPVRWGILGPGGIAGNFATGLSETDAGDLVALAGRNPKNVAAFAERFGVARDGCYVSYDALLASPEVEAVYIATPHMLHAQLALDALRAGKHVLVEKPAGMIAGETIAMAGAAEQEGLFFMEGLMYRCHPQIARMVEIVQSGEIGEVREIEASFGFAAGFDPKSRLFDPDLGGGAILDVGPYPISFSRLMAGVGVGQDFADPVSVQGTGRLAPSGADEEAHCLLTFPSGIIARCAVATRREMPNDARVIGTKGMVRLPNPWVPGRNEGPSDSVIEVTVGGETRVEEIADPRMLFAFEAELASRAIRSGALTAPAPAPSPADSIGTQRVLDSWRHQLRYTLPGETPAGLRRLNGTMPADLPTIPRLAIPGAEAEVSALIMGCDNRDTLAEGAVVWDAWWEAGGNTFDTGFVYGGGLHEKVLGLWLAARGLTKEAQVIVKGAHSPYCVPDAIALQLEISLDRLGLDRAPIYIMHRDNADVPVGEFVDALNALRDKGLIGAFGGSNWSVERFTAAGKHAEANGQQPMTILNNNLSLAVMERPVWPGCVTSNDAETLAFLRESGTAHLSWSSQARGFFLNPGQGTELSEDTRPDVCFDSKGNRERRKRAAKLAKERGVAAHNVATAWVLAQSFPSAALIGPRSPAEIASTLPAMTLSLTEGEVAWLNLEAEAP